MDIGIYIFLLGAGFGGFLGVIIGVWIRDFRDWLSARKREKECERMSLGLPHRGIP